MLVTKDYENLTDPAVLDTIARALRERLAVCKFQLKGEFTEAKAYVAYWESELKVVMEALAIVGGAAHA